MYFGIGVEGFGEGTIFGQAQLSSLLREVWQKKQCLSTFLCTYYTSYADLRRTGKQGPILLHPIEAPQHQTPLWHAQGQKPHAGNSRQKAPVPGLCGHSHAKADRKRRYAFSLLQDTGRGDTAQAQRGRDQEAHPRCRKGAFFAKILQAGGHKGHSCPGRGQRYPDTPLLRVQEKALFRSAHDPWGQCGARGTF